METSKTRYLTIEQLMGLNDKYGSATDIKLSFDANPQDIQRKMVRLLSDPYLNLSRKQGAQTATSFHNEAHTPRRGLATANDAPSQDSNDHS